jgi:Domain of Unknown Function (DUF748)
MRVRVPRLSVRDWRVWLAGGLVVLVALVYALSFFIDEPIRRSVEREMNARLKGYTVSLGGASFHPHGFSLDLTDVTLVQDANPDPPVMRIARLGASVQWRALLHARVVADMVIDRPSLYVNLAHLKAEVKEEQKDKIPITERGWQDALQAAYPLTINEIDVVDGDVTYVDPAQPFKPLRLTRLFADIQDIRNIKSKARAYPSELQVRAVVFDNGRLQIDGIADFLAKPFPGLKGRVSLEQMELGYFQPVARRYNVTLTGGVLSLGGQFEYGPSFKALALEHVTVRGAHVEYVHTSRTAAEERQTAASTAETAKQVTNRPDIAVVIDRVDVLGTTIGFVNSSPKGQYRLYFTDTDLHLTGLTNQTAEGPAHLTMKGKFMGSGATEATATFLPSKKGGELTLNVSIENTDLVKLNDLLRAYGKFDVAAGEFSLYSDINVKNGAIQGYAKPLFKDILTHEPSQDADKSFGQKVKERLIGGAAKILKNRPRGEVATKTEISGRIDNPQTSIVQIVSRLIENAFFKAILPGFDRSVQTS